MFFDTRRSAQAAVVGVMTVGMAAALPGAAQGLNIARANLAKTASFTITQTTAPKGGSKVSQVARVEVKGNKARVEYSNPQIGQVMYLANEKGVFLYIPANKVAQKQDIQGGVDQFLQSAFRQVNAQLKTARKIGAATVSGQKTDVYKDARTGALLYIGRNPGFRLPVKTELKNEGGQQTLLVTNIKTNIALPDARFAVPAGVQVLKATGAAGGLSGPGFPGAGR